jgi:hypothetical protein
MICPKCKITDNAFDAIFCHNCGTKLKESRKSCIWAFVILAITALIVFVIWHYNEVNSYSSNNQNQNTNTYTLGDNNVIVTETPVEVVVENYSVDSTIATSDYYYYSENVLYSNYTDGNYAYCNGIYPGPSWDEDESLGAQYFSTNLGNSLTRNHFKIFCQFYIEEHKDQWVLMLSESYRVLGINLNNGNIYISTNNQEKYYNTGYTYQLNTWNNITVEYNYGSIKVNNDKWFSVDINTQDGDNVLSSINYSNGNAFKGYLSNIVVANLE